jgi:hypothetical protein
MIPVDRNASAKIETLQLRSIMKASTLLLVLVSVRSFAPNPSHVTLQRGRQKKKRLSEWFATGTTSSLTRKHTHTTTTQRYTMANDGYYDFFAERTNHGIVLNSYLSSTPDELTEDEIAEREGWTTTLEELRRYYCIGRPDQPPPLPPPVTTCEGVLQQRIVATRLETFDMSSHSLVAEERDGRMYPETISEWNDFEHQVLNFIPARADLEPDLYDIFNQSVRRSETARRDERGEQEQLIDNLNSTLVRSGMVLEISSDCTVFGVVKGRPDFVLKMRSAEGTVLISVVGESKSTHNLRLPIDAGQIVAEYNAAYQTVSVGRQGRTLEWGNICHPIAQLLGYMVDNERRYGALTSGTRTYFVYISGDSNSSIVHISNAWFVGQVNYLRAWAYVYKLGCEQFRRPG